MPKPESPKRVKPALDSFFVAGTHHYNGAHVAKLGPCELVKDPNNQYDPRAIKIFQSGKMLGYVPSQLAPFVLCALDLDRPFIITEVVPDRQYCEIQVTMQQPIAD